MEYSIADGKVQTRALEYHIADHCNLRCDHCCSFSPILKKWFADPVEFERDLRAVSRVVAPQFLKIVGGEPLLHPELERLLVIARGLAVGGRIQLTTNAFLIERLTPRGWDCLDMIAVSLYPEPALPKSVIRFIAREGRRRNIEVNWKVQDQFTCLDRTQLADRAETVRTFADCWIRHRCNSIKHGRFYCCTRPQYVQKFASDPQAFLDDGVPVSDPDAHALALRIKAHLEQTEPLQSCYLCQGGCAPLDTNRQLAPMAVARKREQMVMLSELIAR
ncbi:MAG TPA: radical SAM protein [Bryobacteraceae bacterium]|nr:radical SAM protein [Bryobacteraceae bacterium]